MTVVLCSKVAKLYKKNKEIKRLRKINLKKKSFIYHAGQLTIMEKFIPVEEEFEYNLSW